jgi:hypothetical protein
MDNVQAPENWQERLQAVQWTLHKQALQWQELQQ